MMQVDHTNRLRQQFVMNDVSTEEWSERGTAGEAKSLRSRVCTPAQLAPFLQRSPARLFGALAFDYLSIIGAAALSIHFANPAAYLLALIWIGGRQLGIGTVGMHEGAHWMMLRNRKHNDWLARALLWSVFAPALTLTLDRFRATHFQHHREVNSSTDPDLPVTQYVCGSRKNAFVILMLGLTGLFGLYLFSLYLREGGWRRRGVALLVVGSLLTAAFMSVRPAQLFIFYYIVPMLTWAMFINQLRTMAEHYPRGQFGDDAGIPDVLLTREVLPSWFDRFFVATRAVNYHLTHHLFPAVPFYNLGRLQRLASHSAAYRASAHVTRGYHRFLIELFTKRRPAVGTQLKPVTV